MRPFRLSRLIGCCGVLLMGGGTIWKDKPPADWSDEDARQILRESPWVKTLRVPIGDLQTEDQRREGGNMGQPHGVGFDGIGDSRPRAQLPRGLLDIVKPESAPQVTSPSVSLQLRWESALPIRVAELKSHNEDAPIEVTDGYTMAIYGVPSGHFQGDPKNLADPLKKEAVLKREGKNDVRPSRVEVIQRDDGLVIVYVFPLSAEVSKKDRRIEFDAQIGRLAIAQSFDVEEMQFQGKLEL